MFPAPTARRSAGGVTTRFPPTVTMGRRSIWMHSTASSDSGGPAGRGMFRRRRRQARGNGTSSGSRRGAGGSCRAPPGREPTWSTSCHCSAPRPSRRGTVLYFSVRERGDALLHAPRAPMQRREGDARSCPPRRFASASGSRESVIVYCTEARTIATMPIAGCFFLLHNHDGRADSRPSLFRRAVHRSQMGG